MSITGVDRRITVEKAMSEKLQALCVYEWPIWTKEVCSFDWHYDDLETRLLLKARLQSEPTAARSVSGHLTW